MPEPSEQFPPAHRDDARAQQADRQATWTWNGKAYTAKVRPVTWAVERETIRASNDADGIEPTRFIEAMLDRIVIESTAALRGIDLMAQDPDYVWTAARELGVIERLRRLGVRMREDGAPRLTIEAILREYLMVEHRLQSKGWKREDLEAMNADDVKYLLVVDERDRQESTMKQATVLAEILENRLGA